MGKVVHFEFPVDDPDRAIAFYEGVFGWKTEQWEGQEYWLVQAGPENEPGIDGAFTKRDADGGPPLTAVVGVESIDTAVKKIEEAGGEITLPKMPIPGVGWAAYFKDPEGNVVGVYQADESAPAPSS